MSNVTERRVIVCGSRDYPDQQLVDFTLSKLFLSAHMYDQPLVIVTGACPTGADFFAGQAAKRAQSSGERIRLEEHPADWSKGKRAGPDRNLAMALLGAELCIAFWDGFSTGTRDMIEKATRQAIPVTVPSAPHRLLIASLMQAFAVAGR